MLTGAASPAFVAFRPSASSGGSVETTGPESRLSRCQAPNGLFRLLQLRRFRRQICLNASSVRAEPAAVAVDCGRKGGAHSHSQHEMLPQVCQSSRACDWMWLGQRPGMVRKPETCVLTWQTGSGLLYAAFAARSGRRTARLRPTQNGGTKISVPSKASRRHAGQRAACDHNRGDSGGQG